MALFYPHNMTFTSFWVLLQALQTRTSTKRLEVREKAWLPSLLGPGQVHPGQIWPGNTGEKNMLLDLPKEDKSKMCTYVVMLRICFTDFRAEHVGFYLCWILLWKMLISIYQHTWGVHLKKQTRLQISATKINSGRNLGLGVQQVVPVQECKKLPVVKLPSIPCGPGPGLWGVRPESTGT